MTIRIKADPSALRRTTWQQYTVRFLFGGLIAVLTGVIAEKFGPAVGGLFLAFPAIFPASATLIEKHEKEKKHQHGLHGTGRGRAAAGLDAAGAAMGALALCVFSTFLWQLLPGHPPWLILMGATLCWLVVSVSIWLIRERV